MLTPYIVDYGVCRECQLVQQVPIPHETQSFYPKSYPMHHLRGKIFSLARKFMIRGVYFEPGEKATGAIVMDFGCGDGAYLQSIRGKVGRGLGFEASSEQAHHIRNHLGCDVYSSLTQAGEDLEAGVDIVTAHFVLEHLTDLHSTFRFWHRILKPGGTLHLVVPNVRSWEARLFGKKWHGLDAPRHISFPDEHSIVKLAEKHGFLITDRRNGIFPNTWSASLTTVFAGRYQHALFLALMPLSFVLSYLLPQSTAVFQLNKSCSHPLKG
jgi:SAM-dependent methyltransferase